MSWIDDVIKAHPHTSWGNRLVVKKDAYGNRVEVAIERAMRSGEPAPFFNCWVFKPCDYVYRLDSNGRPMPGHPDWAKDLIAQALEVDKARVRLGFGEDEFDVRPF